MSVALGDFLPPSVPLCRGEQKRGITPIPPDYTKSVVAFLASRSPNGHPPLRSLDRRRAWKV